ncbi:uncharacterized protein LOC111469595 isoform X2 [Cucurbita maxima]|uniref:Uncharacterized protein LOC111469595 isoform X2 n=1 Tax=Cucurbita maxima TaxID=3661 RepID=A0A6J1I4M3_CUCMA|nr:uncharacterized protein LOC111469595 isoform X2 [Cucurbita maxima]
MTVIAPLLVLECSRLVLQVCLASTAYLCQNNGEIPLSCLFSADKAYENEASHRGRDLIFGGVHVGAYLFNIEFNARCRLFIRYVMVEAVYESNRLLYRIRICICRSCFFVLFFDFNFKFKLLIGPCFCIPDVTMILILFYVNTKLKYVHQCIK